MIIEFDKCMRHVWLKKNCTFGENLYLSEQQIQVFSPLFTDNTFTNWFQLDSSTAMYSRGKISKGGELETNV